MDLSSLPSYEPSEIFELKNTIAIMLRNYKLLFNKLIKPVQHFATHFPSNIEDFGPLRFLQSMRYTFRQFFNAYLILICHFQILSDQKQNTKK